MRAWLRPPTVHAGLADPGSNERRAPASGHPRCTPASRTPLPMTYDLAIIGGGIVGLATARALRERAPDARLVILEKEPRVAGHQTGHNSGVIHSGIYYKPGSYKAKLTVEGKGLMYQFCEKHGIRIERCGKVIVATTEAELPRLQTLYERGIANGVPVEPLEP